MVVLPTDTETQRIRAWVLSGTQGHPHVTLLPSISQGTFLSPRQAPRHGAGLATHPGREQGRKEACARHNSKEVPGLVAVISVSPLLQFCLVMGEVTAVGKRGCPRAVTLPGLPGAPLLRAGMVNTSDSGEFGGGG